MECFKHNLNIFGECLSRCVHVSMQRKFSGYSNSRTYIETLVKFYIQLQHDKN